MLHKKTPLQQNKAEAYYLRVFASEESYNRYLLNSYLHNYICKPGAMYGRKSNHFTLTFLFSGCLVYQIYQVQYLQSHKPGFWGYKIIK